MAYERLDRNTRALSPRQLSRSLGWTGRQSEPHQIIRPHDAGREAVESLIAESKFFIEWTAPEAEVNIATELVELQIQLPRWQYNWARMWDDPVLRSKLAEESAAWSQRVLEMSGLLSR